MRLPLRLKASRRSALRLFLDRYENLILYALDRLGACGRDDVQRLVALQLGNLVALQQFGEADSEVEIVHEPILNDDVVDRRELQRLLDVFQQIQYENFDFKLIRQFDFPPPSFDCYLFYFTTFLHKTQRVSERKFCA